MRGRAMIGFWVLQDSISILRRPSVRCLYLIEFCLRATRAFRSSACKVDVVVVVVCKVTERERERLTTSKCSALLVQVSRTPSDNNRRLLLMQTRANAICIRASLPWPLRSGSLCARTERIRQKADRFCMILTTDTSDEAVDQKVDELSLSLSVLRVQCEVRHANDIHQL